jgi:arabinofuranosyltransferase
VRAARAGLNRLAATEIAVLAVSAAFYVTFIVRSGVEIAGRTYYALIDDAAISMTFARSLADGHGLVWQPGPHVEGYTNFLWTLWMAVVHLLPISERFTGLAVMISGAAILVATMLVVRSICRDVVPDRSYVAPAAMALVGLCYPLTFWTLRGMETGLCALLLALAALLALRLPREGGDRRLAALGAVLAAAVLTRDDMLVPAAVIVAFACWSGGRERWRRRLVVCGGIVAAAVVAHVAFRLAYYHDALPNTYYLKLGGVPLGTRLHRGVAALAWSGLTAMHVTIVLAGVALLSAWRSARARPLALLAAVFLSECLYSVYVGGDFAEQGDFPNRFIAPVLPLAVVLAAIGASDLARGLDNARTRRAVACGAAVVLVAAAIVQSRGWAWTHVLYIPDSRPASSAARVAFALIALALVACVLAARSPGGAQRQAVVFLSLLVLALAALNYAPMRTFARSGPQDRSIERLETGRALIFRRFSAPSSRIALVAAGNWRYFSHRPSVDLLGKVDPVIAHGPSRAIVFKPGHTKWDYDYSIGRLRPDALEDLTFATDAERCRIAGWGYRQIAPHLFVRQGAAGIDVPRLAAAMRAFDRRPPLPESDRCPAGG